MSLREALGSWMGLRLRTARRPVLLGPAWASICGAIASGQMALTGRDGLFFVLALFLADPLLDGVWAAVASLRWPGSSRGTGNPNPGPSLESKAEVSSSTSLSAPVLEPLTVPWRVLTDWTAVLEFLWALVPALAIALLLGRAVAVVVVAAIALSLLRRLLQGPGGLSAPFHRALVEVALAWLIGYLTFVDFGLLSEPTFYGALSQLLPAWQRFGFEPWFLAGAYALAYYASLTLDKRRRLTEKLLLLSVSQVLVAVLLIVEHRALAAGVVLLLLVGQILFQPYLRRYRKHLWYLRHTQYHLMGSMLAAAIGLAGWRVL